MKIVSALVVVFALLIALGPSPGAAKIKCAKQDVCLSKKDNKPFTKSNPEEAALVDCDECAAWGCLKDGKVYLGLGCKGVENVCKDGKNQEKDKFHDATSRFVSCKEESLVGCAHAKYEEFSLTLPQMDVTYDGECTPNELSKVTTTTSKDGTKIGALTIGGMMTLAWMVAHF